jgi:hypothetical protein
VGRAVFLWGVMASGTRSRALKWHTFAPDLVAAAAGRPHAQVALQLLGKLEGLDTLVRAMEAPASPAPTLGAAGPALQARASSVGAGISAGSVVGVVHGVGAGAGAGIAGAGSGSSAGAGAGAGTSDDGRLIADTHPCAPAGRASGSSTAPASTVPTNAAGLSTHTVWLCRDIASDVFGLPEDDSAEYVFGPQRLTPHRLTPPLPTPTILHEAKLEWHIGPVADS